MKSQLNQRPSDHVEVWQVVHMSYSFDLKAGWFVSDRLCGLVISKFPDRISVLVQTRSDIVIFVYSHVYIVEQVLRALS